MTITITATQVISVLVGVVIGYKLKTQIQTAINSFKKFLATSIAPKP